MEKEGEQVGLGGGAPVTAAPALESWIEGRKVGAWGGTCSDVSRAASGHAAYAWDCESPSQPISSEVDAIEETAEPCDESGRTEKTGLEAGESEEEEEPEETEVA